MGMVMKFPNGETRNLLIEVFNYKRVCALQICYTAGFSGLSDGRPTYRVVCVRMRGTEEERMCMFVCKHIMYHQCLHSVYVNFKNLIRIKQGKSYSNYEKPG